LTQKFNIKEETFGISSSSTSREDHEARQESRHAMNMTPNDPRTEASTCKSSGTLPENSEACIARIQVLTVKETTSKSHMQVHTNKESCKKQSGRNTGPNRPRKGLGRSAQSNRPKGILAGSRRPLPSAATSNKSFYRRHSPQNRRRKMRERVR
jgi:hypothetical protein